MPESLYHNPELKFNREIPEGKTTWQSPSNIALVKYWGKRDVQIPMNPSVSFTLEKSFTETTVEYAPAARGFDLTFYFDGERNKTFEEKTKKFFQSLSPIFPFINQLSFKIHSQNSFPHSAGIASSASGMSALALALCDLEQTHFNTLADTESFYRKASYIARLGSGSAARSVYGGLVLWGETDYVEGSSNLYGKDISSLVNDRFLQYNDTILLVDASSKKVSSRAGHALMKTNDYASTRFRQAHQNIGKILKIMQSDNLENFIRLVESEALTLHAMMMTSLPYYLLLKPNTLQIIDKIFEFRQDTQTPVCFTLDAGPNVHLLYPKYAEEAVHGFIDNSLKPYLSEKGLIHDRVGTGPKKISR